jgi:hypothetical protein
MVLMLGLMRMVVQKPTQASVMTQALKPILG